MRCLSEPLASVESCASCVPYVHKNERKKGSELRALSEILGFDRLSPGAKVGTKIGCVEGEPCPSQLAESGFAKTAIT